MITKAGATSTSIHQLNGDSHLSPAGKIGYFFLNWVNNTFPRHRLDPRMGGRDFHCSDLPQQWAQVEPGSSPSRTLCDLFWRALPWSRIQQELSAIRVLDVGCGSGQYGRHLMAWSHDRIASYTGVDLDPHPSWPALERGDTRLRFVQADAADIGDVVPVATNFIMSQSSIEHMDSDLQFFERVRQYVASIDGPVLQVHLCPSAACLKLYLFHGVRQYTPRTLSTVTQRFDNADIMLYGLGGSASNRLHLQFITYPLLIRGVDYRVTRAAEYERRLFAAIEQDMSRPQRSPAFYALVIHSHPRTTLFT